MSKTYFAAADIGGTKISVGLVDAEGRVLGSRKFKTPVGENGAERAKDEMLSAVQVLCETLHIPALSGMGVVCAGPVDTVRGVVENPFTLPGWDGYPLAGALSEALHVPVILENDANGALLGAVRQMGLQEKRVLLLLFGTGIGVAFWDGAALYRAGDGYHPEMGHLIVSGEKTECYCGHSGCFEALCSGKALNGRAAAAGFCDFDTLRTAAENPDATALLNHIRTDIQNGVWNLNVLFKPDVILLGGGIAEKHCDFFAQTILEDAANGSEFLRPFEVIKTSPSMDAALSGASMLFGRH